MHCTSHYLWQITQERWTSINVSSIGSEPVVLKASRCERLKNFRLQYDSTQDNHIHVYNKDTLSCTEIMILKWFTLSTNAIKCHHFWGNTRFENAFHYVSQRKHRWELRYESTEDPCRACPTEQMFSSRFQSSHSIRYHLKIRIKPASANWLKES